MANITGTEQGDILFGTTADDMILGLGGNDRILASDGTDTVSGGEGDDNINGDAGNDTLTGDNGNDTLSGDAGMDILNGGAGDDVITLSAMDIVDGGDGMDAIRVDLNTITTTSGLSFDHTNFNAGAATIAALYGSTVVNVEFIDFGSLTPFDDVLILGSTFARSAFVRGGNGNDSITGGNGSNQLFGEGGNDTLTGGANGNQFDGGNGDDMITGGAGFDTLTVSNTNGTVTVNLLTGTSTGTGLIGNDTISSIERVNLFAQTANFTGNAQDNIIQISAANGVVAGGDGNDTYLITLEIQTVSIVETMNGGTADRVQSAGSFTLADHIETLVSTRDGNFTLTGNQTANLIIGDRGANMLNGLGGDDRLEGGAGSDRVSGGDGNDVLDESTAGSTDASADTLFGDAGNDILRGGGGNDVLVGGIGDDVLTGAADHDVLVAGDGNDSLSGGTGLNELIGGTGNDVYIVETRTDSTFELAGEGNDEVRTTFFIYGLQNHVENLTYTDNAQHGAGVGNGLDNILTGGTGIDDLFGREGNDTLRGGSGAANTLLGQEGDDVYIVTATGDSVIEFASQGTDTVETALASFTLRNHVENLTYTGTATFTGIGADNDNVLRGGAGADFLSGLGGADIIIGGSGADTVLGGAGADEFALSFGGATSVDRILDFTSGTDKISFDNRIINQSQNFVIVQGAGEQAATTFDAAFLYNSTNGRLSYDIDGAGSQGAVLYAILNAGLSLAPGDFIIY